ncbi:MAG TPA: hypothetical protein VGQ76_23375 [Thermoanaerobaculia bacterium]|jgi:hypothetical protein|nr:hypothetical protein [Thermoanaerobaculia bacterium]
MLRAPAQTTDNRPPTTRLTRVLLTAAILWIAALTQRGQPLAVDEVEFFRATKWVGEGQVPFRDFWEHHLPLQWIVFGPVASVFANGPGVEAIVAMRWAQMVAWLAIFVLLVKIARRSGVDPWSAIVLLLVSTSFVRKAIEYRVDVPANLAFLGAVALIAFGANKRGWIGFGVLMSAVVLTNMRMAPVVVIAALLSLFWRAEERRWGWNRAAVWMIAGVVPVAVAFVGWLFATGAWPAFIEGVFRYNTMSATLLEVDTLFDALLMPLWTLDVAGVAFWLAAIIGAVLALRTIREPGPLQVLALLFVASVATIALMEVQYDYHFQNTYLLMLPLAALALTRVHVVPLVAGGALCIFLIQALPSFGDAMEYQDAVMTSADRLTKPDETVLDGAGFALRREPAYRYWFLTTGVRFMAPRGLMEPYTITRPPGAIIYDYRLALYLRDFPRVAEYLTKHYVPVYRNLWVPGMSAIVGRERVIWFAPRAGAYDVWTNEGLVTHPWFTKPFEYAAIEGPQATRFVIPLDLLQPVAPDALMWLVDGVVQPTGTRALTLRAGSRVELISTAPRPTGILLVPRGIRVLCIAPAEEHVF